MMTHSIEIQTEPLPRRSKKNPENPNPPVSPLIKEAPNNQPTSKASLNISVSEKSLQSRVPQSTVHTKLPAISNTREKKLQQVVNLVLQAEELSVKIKELGEVRGQYESRLSEEMSEKKQQKEKVKQYEKLLLSKHSKNQRIRSETTKLCESIDRINLIHKIDVKENTLKALKQELAAAKSKEQSLQEISEQQNKEYDEMRDKMFVDTSIEALKTAIESTKKEIAAVDKQIKTKQAQLASQQSSCKVTKKSFSAHEEEDRELVTQLPESETSQGPELRELEAKHTEYRKVMEEKLREFNRLAEEIESLNKKSERIKKSLRNSL